VITGGLSDEDSLATEDSVLIIRRMGECQSFTTLNMEHCAGVVDNGSLDCVGIRHPSGSLVVMEKCDNEDGSHQRKQPGHIEVATYSM
jgi:hypothetical protein